MFRQDGEMVAKGRTVLFVSHNMQTVAAGPDRAGNSAARRPHGGDGKIRGNHLEQISGASTSRRMIRFTRRLRERENGTGPEITRVEVHTSSPGQVQQFGKPMTIDIEIQYAGTGSSFQRLVSDFDPEQPAGSSRAEPR